MRAFLRAFALAAAIGALAANPVAAQVGKNLPSVDTPAARGDYLTSADARGAAINKLLDQMGGLRPVSKLEIRPDEIIVWTQNPYTAHYTDSWTIRHLKVWVFGGDTVSGPNPTDGDGIVKRQEGSFFALDKVNLNNIDRLVAGGIAMAQMSGVPKLTSLTVARQISILPEPAYGDVRLTLQLNTERESATIYANADSEIIGADLAGTSRAQRLDLIADDDWPMQEAQRRIAEVLGLKKVHELRIYNGYVFLEAEHPTRKNMTINYSWDLGGVRSGHEMEDVFASMRDTAGFGMDEIDLTRLPEVKRAALAAFDSAGAAITYIDADKPTDRASTPRLLWTVDLRQSDGEAGKVVLDANAEVVEVVLPPSRVAAAMGPWLAPATVVATLKRLEKEFGADARFGEILIDDTKGSILVEDPQAPGTMANFIIDAQTVHRFGTPMPWEAELDRAKSFTIGELAALDADTIAGLEKDTLAQMKLEGMEVFRYTFSKKMLMMAPEDTRLMVEIRAGKNDGWTSGWATFEVGGKQTDVMLP